MSDPVVNTFEETVSEQDLTFTARDRAEADRQLREIPAYAELMAALEIPVTAG